MKWVDVFETEHRLRRFHEFNNENNPWTLSEVEKRVADERLRNVRVPHGFDWKPHVLFNQLAYMKSIIYRKVSH